MSTTHISEPTEPNAKSKCDQLLETISLRDYFAAKAMQGILAGELATTELATIARDCYAIAEAMLEERES